MINTFYQALGTKLRTYRKIRKMTIGEIAREINKSIATVSKYEKGEIAIDIETLFTWCNFMGVNISSLFPDSQTNSVHEQIKRYQKHLFERLYFYNYKGKTRTLCNGVIECDNHTCKVRLYLFAKDIENYFDCEYLYEGSVTYSDAYTNFVVNNVHPPFDMIALSVPTMTGKSEYTIGLLSSTTTRYENIALKTLVSKKPVKDTQLLEKKLKLTSEDLKNIRSSNFFIVS